MEPVQARAVADEKARPIVCFTLKQASKSDIAKWRNEVKERKDEVGTEFEKAEVKPATNRVESGKHYSRRWTDKAKKFEFLRKGLSEEFKKMRQEQAKLRQDTSRSSNRSFATTMGYVLRAAIAVVAYVGLIIDK